jgi:hypothetical protein
VMREGAAFLLDGCPPTGVSVLLGMLVFAYFGAARELNFLDIGARGEQDFSGDGVSAQTAR